MGRAPARAVSRFALGAFLAFLALPAAAEVGLTLKKSFIEKYKNRLTIETKFIVDAAHKNPNPANKDADLHIAGRPGSEIGLATVGEIQNAKEATEALQFIRQNTGTNVPARFVGVWRVWFEHSGGTDQVQGKPLTKSKSTNPDHVFEIHPVTRINDIDLLGTLRFIEGYTKPDNTDARIRMVESLRGSIRVKGQKVTIQRKGGNDPNYIAFVMKLLPGNHGFQKSDKTWTQPQDGKFVFAAIYDLEEDELLVRKRRVGFVAGSEPFQKLATMMPNECLKVLGITRINLELVSWRVKNKKQRPDVLAWDLPYELIAVGTKGDKFKCAEEEDE